MFNKALFQYEVNKKGLTFNLIADRLGVNPATLYRKMNGSSDFTRAEIQMLRNILNLNADESDKIFFAQ